MVAKTEAVPAAPLAKRDQIRQLIVTKHREVDARFRRAWLRHVSLVSIFLPDGDGGRSKRIDRRFRAKDVKPFIIYSCGKMS